MPQLCAIPVRFYKIQDDLISALSNADKKV